MHTRGQGNGIYCERHLRCSIFCVPLIVYQLFKIIRSAFGMGRRDIPAEANRIRHV